MNHNRLFKGAIETNEKSHIRDGVRSHRKHPVAVRHEPRRMGGHDQNRSKPVRGQYTRGLSVRVYGWVKTDGRRLLFAGLLRAFASRVLRG